MAQQILVDCPQMRVKDDRITALSCGSEWDFATQSGVFVERSTGTAMCLPNVLYPDWLTNGSGNFARYNSAVAYDRVTFGASGGTWAFEDVSSTGMGDWFASPGVAVNDILFWPVQPKNAAIWLAFFPFGSEAQGQGSYTECGWSDPSSGPSTVALTSLRLYANGKVEVYRNGIYDGEGTASPSQDNGQKLPQAFVGFLIIPSRGKELLIVSSQGGAFSHVFDDIDENATDPIITPATQFWTYTPMPQTAKVQVAPIVFPAPGTIATLLLSFRRPPTSAQIGIGPHAKLFGRGAATPALLNVAGTAVYDNLRDLRIQATLHPSAGNRSSDFVYGAQAWFDPVLASTADGTIDLAGNTVESSFEVGDDFGATSFRYKVSAPEAIQAAVPLFLTLGNRSVGVKFDGAWFLNGQAKCPSWEMAWTDEVQRLEQQVYDAAALAHEYLFSEAIAQDGMQVADLFKFLADLMGCDYDIDDPGLVVPSVGAPGASGEFGTVWEVGNTAGEWLKRLHESYVANWFVAITPGTNGKTLSVKDPAGMTTTPFVTLYPSIAQAVTIGGHSLNVGDANAAWRFVYRTVHTETLEPEANEVVVCGRDPRTGRPLISSKVNAASQDPTIAPNARDENWLGTPRKYGWRDENGITSMDLANRCADLLYDRLSKPWKLREIQAELQFKPGGSIGWKGDVLNLYGIGPVRIKSLSGNSEKEPRLTDGDTWQFRPTRYVCEENLRVTNLRTSARTLRGIKEAYHLRIQKRAFLPLPPNGFFVGHSPIVGTP